MKRLISIAVSLIILAIIYSKIDFPRLIQVFQNCDRWWMAISLSMVVPITMLTAWRLQQLMPKERQEARGERLEENEGRREARGERLEENEGRREARGERLEENEGRREARGERLEENEGRREARGERLEENVEIKGRREVNSLKFGEANRLILAASVLNMVLPSKMGDIAKAYFMKERGHLNGALSLSLVVFEKACDLLSLLLWCVFGLILYQQKDLFSWVMTSSVTLGLVIGLLLLSSRKFTQIFFILGRAIAPKKFRHKIQSLRNSWEEMHNYFWRDKTQLFKVATTSVFIWFLHLVQIWFFILALKAWTPFITNLALSPLAIFAGLLPLTFAGVGTRDAALIALYQPYFNAPTAAALGLLCTSRYIIPAIAGLPFLRQYLATLQNIRGNKKQSLRF